MQQRELKISSYIVVFLISKLKIQRQNYRFYLLHRWTFRAKRSTIREISVFFTLLKTLRTKHDVVDARVAAWGVHSEMEAEHAANAGDDVVPSVIMSFDLGSSIQTYPLKRRMPKTLHLAHPPLPILIL